MYHWAWTATTLVDNVVDLRVDNSIRPQTKIFANLMGNMDPLLDNRCLVMVVVMPS